MLVGASFKGKSGYSSLLAQARPTSRKHRNIDELLIDVQPALEQNNEIYETAKVKYSQKQVANQNCISKLILRKNRIAPDQDQVIHMHNSERAKKNWVNMKQILLK